MVRIHRRVWCLRLALIIAAGILSRMAHTGFVLFDKYLGDALYAAMVYAVLRLLSRTANAAPWTAAIMIAIESFQLTMIPAHMLPSTHALVRICARLMGTQFSFLDLAAYAAGILLSLSLETRSAATRSGKTLQDEVSPDA